MRDETITAFLDQLAARVPAPGGGATAALHAAQSAALLAMVARYSDGAKYDADLMSHIITEADGIRNDALTLAERDAAAFGAVADAYALPKATDEERQARSAAITTALAEAARAAAVTAQVNIEVNLRGMKDPTVEGELAAMCEVTDEVVARADGVVAAVREEIS